MAFKTVAQSRADFLKRPKFAALFEDLITNKFGVLHLFIVNQVRLQLYNKYALTDPNYEKITAVGGITLPAGVAYTANGKMYKLNSGTTPVLTADLYRLKKLWIEGDTALETVSKSTYDSLITQGSGIPDDTTVIAVTDVYHELVGEDVNQELRLVIGTTAAGSAPAVKFTYVPQFANLTSDSDELDIPVQVYQSEFITACENLLQQYVGQFGF